MKCSLALIPLTLAAWCYADFAPPIVNISLDEPPKERWAPLMKVIDVSYFRNILPQIIAQVGNPKWVHQAIKPVVETLEDYIPQHYAGEIQGLASLSGIDITDIILANFVYEITAFCTSIVAQDTNGRIYHGRNMDFAFVEILRNLTVDIIFIRDGKVAYRGTSFAGYVGLWTGQSANKFTISGNQRDDGFSLENVTLAIILKNTPASWLIRETLEEAASYQDALERLSKVPIITPVYYIVGGVQPGEGAVVTRNSSGAADVWELDPPHGQWFRVETNYDHWNPPPHGDDRRTPTIKALNDTGQKNINLDSLFKVLSANATCNRGTIYTTVMSAGTPEKYRTVMREKCNWIGVPRSTNTPQTVSVSIGIIFIFCVCSIGLYFTELLRRQRRRKKNGSYNSKLL
ncbi:N-acylethanolamine-hydrolyzing acid amidase-like [Paramormyrops kingsleyae]|uniref:N-acylethanolamine-hydrolyzing acid amidase n=1 Tax=Paramormyrops kingsleyae TaxID=1676925 RepID=A0A3B3QTU1_9TELE|nr:N-acylethanolamine-hydrolyzing acid amidase-like [Paramormyrops kingsleyae]